MFKRINVGYFNAVAVAQEHGSILDVAVAGLRHGQQVNFLWAIENGRLTQTIFFFLVGIMIGRRRLFYNEGNNLEFWKKVLKGAAVAFAILVPLYYIVPKQFDSACISNSLNVMLNMWKNLSMMLMIVSGITLLYYLTEARNWLIKIAPYGKMSLTNYLSQSIFGAMLFYNWGFGLSSVRFICGTQQIHKDLEKKISNFLGMDDTIEIWSNDKLEQSFMNIEDFGSELEKVMQREKGEEHGE